MKKRIILLALIGLLGRTDINAQTINTIAGDGVVAFTGDGGPATSASLKPLGIIKDRYGNIYFTDEYSHRIRKISVTGIITTVAGNGSTSYSGDGMAATATGMYPTDVAVDTFGNLYIADANNHRVRKVNTAGIISTIAGTGVAGWSGDGSAAVSAKLYSPYSLAIDTHGNLFIGQIGNTSFYMYVRKVKLSTGIITTYAGTGSTSYSGADNHLATWGGVVPTGLTTDTSGNLYIADRVNNSIRKVNIHDTITTIAGTGVNGFSGDGGSAISAKLYNPTGVAVDTSNNLYISDGNNFRIRKVNLTTGIISTYCGTGTAGFSGDGGPATAARTANITGKIIADNYGVIFSDDGNNRIRRICFSINVPTISITGTDTICAGTAVTYTSSVTGGGASPMYQWQVNSINVSTGSTFSYTPLDGDVVKCILTSSASCSFPDTAVSSLITMVVHPMVYPTISIAASAVMVCEGTTVGFTSSITGGGISPAYQWKVNGITVGTGSSYSYSPSDIDVVKCIVTSTATCATPATVTSAAITMVVNPLPAVYSVGGSGTYLDTGIVTLSSSQTGVSYQLYNGTSAYGSPVAGTGGILTFKVTSSGIYYIIATGTLSGCADTMAASANVIVNPTIVTNVWESTNIRIYPNPARDLLNIEGSQLYKIQVVDLTGRILINIACDRTKFTIDIDNLKTGLYLIKINGQFVRKFIKE